MVYAAENYTTNVLFDYNVSKQCSGDIPTEYCCEISIYISHFTIFAPKLTTLKFPKIMRAVLSSEIDTYGSNRPNKNSTSQRYSFGVIQISI